MIQQSESPRANHFQPQQLKFTYLPTNIESRKAKKGVNKGKCKTYISFCQRYLNYNKRRMIKHIGICGNCQRIRLNLNTQSLNPLPAELIPHIPRQSFIQTQIDKLNSQIENLKTEIRNSSHNSIVRRVEYQDLEADQLALHVYQRNKIQIQQIILKKISMVINESRKARINIENNLMPFGSKIVNQIRKLQFQQCIQDCSHKLQQAHKELMKDNFHLKTKQRYQSCFRFLSQYTQIQLKTFANIFEDYLKLSATKRKYLKIYWQNIKKILPYFANFPQLPQLREQRVRRMTFSPQMTIQKAGKKLLSLLADNKHQLLCDIWLLLLLGLRFGDLLRVRLYNENRQYYKFIKLVQNKNKNLTIRFLPESLCLLCEYTQSIYPLSVVRLRAAVRYCLEHFRCAYGFKHKVISHIVAVFNQQSAFGRFHKSSSTTSQFYIDKNCQFLLNSIFKFPITLTVDEQSLQRFQNRQFILDLTEKRPKQIQIKDQIQNQIIINDGVDLSQRISILNSDGIPHDENQNLQVSIAQNHQLELGDRLHEHLGSAILAVDQQDVVQQIERSLSQKSVDFADRSVLEALSSITNRQERIEQEVFTPTTSKSNEVEIVVAKNKFNKYQIAQIPISKSRQQARQAKKKALERFDSRRIDPYKLLCKICKQNRIFSRLSTDNWAVKCTHCKFSHQQRRQQTPFKSKLNIQWTGNKQHNFWPLIPTKSSGNSNQINKYIQEQFPSSFKQNHLYCSDFPSNIKISLPFIPGKLEKELEKALESQPFLPLRISKSTIKDAGNGVFATQRIQRNSLICCYRCVIGTSYSIDSQLDSNFTIGWSQQADGTPIELLADGVTNAGIGRYINSKADNQSNCRALIGITFSQIYIFIVSKNVKHIQSGQQLFYYYGDRFFFQNEKKSSTEAVQSDEESLEHRNQEIIEAY